jgi:hypothetical protein
VVSSAKLPPTSSAGWLHETDVSAKKDVRLSGEGCARTTRPPRRRPRARASTRRSRSEYRAAIPTSKPPSSSSTICRRARCRGRGREFLVDGGLAQGVQRDAPPAPIAHASGCALLPAACAGSHERARGGDRREQCRRQADPRRQPPAQVVPGPRPERRALHRPLGRRGDPRDAATTSSPTTRPCTATSTASACDRATNDACGARSSTTASRCSTPTRSMPLPARAARSWSRRACSRKTKSEDELAAVLAHEIAHVTLRTACRDPEGNLAQAFTYLGAGAAQATMDQEDLASSPGCSAVRSKRHRADAGHERLLARGRGEADRPLGRKFLAGDRLRPRRR